MKREQMVKYSVVASLALLAIAVLFSVPHAHDAIPFVPFIGLAVTHGSALRDTLCNAAVDSIDAGAGAGTLEFQTSGNVEVATLTFSDPAFGAASSGTATASAITADSSATGGTIAKAVMKDSDGTTRISCSVTATGGGGDIELNSVVVSAGQQVSVSSLTYSAPA